MTEQSESATLHIPPKYNLRGYRQLWFFETGHENIDNLGNGIITGILVIAVAMVGLPYLVEFLDWAITANEVLW